MRILPEDLGEKWNAALVRLRATPSRPAFGPARFLCNARGMGVLGRLWTRGQVSDPDRADKLASAAGLSLAFPTFLSSYFAFIVSILAMAAGIGKQIPADAILSLMVGIWVLGGTVGVTGSRALFRRFHQQPITPEEVDALLDGCSEEIDRAFLGLVRDTTRQSAPPETEANVRAALQALEAAIGRLPAVQVSILNADALRAEAATLLAQASTEPDRVTAESMERRARAIEHRGEANERSALLARRSTALREEILAQIEALREGVAALSTHAPDFSGLAFLAQTARQVASEAGELSSAREELDSSLAGLPPPAVVEEPVRVRAS